ncbi:Protein of unknown function [Gryllus bimaculatus]|nr:Protein of unknown function [Gryllus bimaculatus]
MTVQHHRSPQLDSPWERTCRNFPYLLREYVTVCAENEICFVTVLTGPMNEMKMKSRDLTEHFGQMGLLVGPVAQQGEKGAESRNLQDILTEPNKQTRLEDGILISKLVPANAKILCWRSSRQQDPHPLGCATEGPVEACRRTGPKSKFNSGAKSVGRCTTSENTTRRWLKDAKNILPLFAFQVWLLTF